MPRARLPLRRAGATLSAAMPVQTAAAGIFKSAVEKPFLKFERLDRSQDFTEQ